MSTQEVDNADDVSNTVDGQETVEGENKENLTEQQTITQENAPTEALEELEGEHFEDEHVNGEHLEGEGEFIEEGKELLGEHLEEELQGEEQEEKKEEPIIPEEQVEEEEQYVEEPPPDPAAPFEFSDSKEALKPHFELRPDQVAEAEQIWDSFQNHEPAYSEIDGYITEKELIYILKSLMLMTYTPEQLEELVAFCVRPPHPEGHINFEQFLRMVTIRQRDFPPEDELRSALQVLDPEKTGTVEREFLKEILLKRGHKMPQKQLDNLIKEVDMSNDGTIGIEDVVGTMCMDLNRDDIIMLKATLNPPEEVAPEE